MSRHVITLHGSADKARALRYIDQAPFGTRAEFKAVKRSLPQNDRMWAMLSDVAMQKEHFGKRYHPEIWKILFMHGWQKETRMIPSLNGHEVIPLTRSSDLSRDAMS